MFNLDFKTKRKDIIPQYNTTLSLLCNIISEIKKKKCFTASCADQHLFNCNPSVCNTPDLAKYCPLTCGSCSAGKTFHVYLYVIPLSGISLFESN